MAISVNMYMHSHDFEGLFCIEPHVQGCGLLLHSLGVPRPSVHDGYPVDTYVCMKVHHIIPLSVSERVCAHIRTWPDLCVVPICARFCMWLSDWVHTYRQCNDHCLQTSYIRSLLHQGQLCTRAPTSSLPSCCCTKQHGAAQSCHSAERQETQL